MIFGGNHSSAANGLVGAVVEPVSSPLARVGLALAAAAATLALTAPNAAAALEPAAVAAQGNPITGELAFVPAEVTVAVGQRVRWTNTDVFAPHTATEESGLWDLGGTYGGTPLTQAGFGPGQSVERRFEAGDFSYYCRVHGDVQSGRVKVPMTVKWRKAGRRKGKQRYAVAARWTRTEVPAGQVFDVQMRKIGGGSWRYVRSDTRNSSLRIAGLRKGTALAFRARLQSTRDLRGSSGWSPAAEVRTGKRGPVPDSG